MYKIEKKDYGFKLTFGDLIQADEMRNWLEESQKALSNIPSKFGVFVDMRTLKPLSADAQKYMQEGQKLYKAKGMERSAVVLENPIISMQFKRTAKETGIYTWERYFNASAIVNWEQNAIDWIKKSIDPDK